MERDRYNQTIELEGEIFIKNDMKVNIGFIRDGSIWKLSGVNIFEYTKEINIQDLKAFLLEIKEYVQEVYSGQKDIIVKTLDDLIKLEDNFFIEHIYLIHISHIRSFTEQNGKTQLLFTNEPYNTNAYIEDGILYRKNTEWVSYK